jgi:hypothetical protein
MNDWRNFVVDIMKELGKESNLTKDIYPLVEIRWEYSTHLYKINI